MGRAAVVVLISLACVAAGVLVGAVATIRALGPPGVPLQLWHTVELDAEFTADRTSQVRNFADYLRLEDMLFKQLDAQVIDQVGTGPAFRLVRYSAGSAADPRTWETNWNRSFELPSEVPRGGVLLLHGRSDSPYNLRAFGLALHGRGYHVVGLRQPGHGTVSAALLTATWEDAAAAVRLAMAHLAARVAGAPLHIVGYSTGGALAVDYALEALERGEVLPDSLVLISPALGISPAAALAEWKLRLAALPGLERLAWADVVPEFDPFNYNSFTVNSIVQAHRLTRGLAARLTRRAEAGPIANFPPTLVLLSSADSTVSVDAVVDNLLTHLDPGSHELLLFDVNRKRARAHLLVADPAPLIERLADDPGLPFALTLVTNAGPDSAEVISRRKPALSADGVSHPLGVAWPADVISLSHVALQFPPDDPLYGRRPDEKRTQVFLGEIALRGETGISLLSAERQLRLRHNPFYDYVETRVVDWLDSTGGGE